MNKEQLKSVQVELTQHHYEYENSIRPYPQEEDVRHKSLPLISQLREEVFGSKNSNAMGAGGFATKAPLNLNAVSLAKELEDYVAGYPGNTLEERLEFLVNETLTAGSDKEIADMARELRSFAGRIRQLIYGPKRRKLNIACNNCNQTWTYNDEGLRELAMTYYEGTTHCLACGETGHIVNYWNLLEALKED